MRTRKLNIFGSLSVAAFALAVSGCAPSPEQEAAQRATAVAYAQATSTAIAAPTVAAQQTAEVATSTAVAHATSTAAAQATVAANATSTAAAQATVAANATSTAVAQATQQARDIETRVQAAVAATQAAIPTATPVPPTATPVPPTQTPVVIVVTEVPQPAAPPVYVPVPLPVPSGLAPQFVLDAINESNNAYMRAKWRLDPTELSGHVISPELSIGQDKVRTLITNKTRVASTLVSGSITSWSYATTSRIMATTNEIWRFVNYDAGTYALKRDTGSRLYRNTYTIDFVAGYGWKVSLDDVPNPAGDTI